MNHACAFVPAGELKGAAVGAGATLCLFHNRTCLRFLVMLLEQNPRFLLSRAAIAGGPQLQGTAAARSTWLVS